MCDPVTAAIVVGVTAVASTGYSIYAQAKSAKAQTKALREQESAAREETRRESSAEIFDSMRQSRREQGQLRAQAGEAGLSLTSGSVEALLMDSAMQGELREQRTLANAESRNRSNQAEAASIASRISKPSVLGAGLQLGASAASAWSGVQGAKIKAG
ncbi:hypothetical protein QUC32_23115 [Novosphingobium resinovorum]|uniref:virion core protein, T7 gp14 family n=1 Tax=Novosphingobium TaxID=165696 RepID=UPI001B3C554A|nr:MULTISPECIES: hypothetical protein [Novosphingobium]MBF7012542.1 hypothetical protein [Novosphingobium sp. HR1a]WJM27276.1 hypothetical protein QUC32_23115 [Novosphingobium resinovorum]